MTDKLPRVPRARADGDAGVAQCLELMTTGKWVPGRSHQALAAEHGVHPDTVKKWATNASRIIRLAIEGDVEDIRAQMLATLGTIVSEAMSYERVLTTRDGDTTVVPQPDLKAAIAAIAEQAKLLGIVTQKHEVAMSPEEIERLIADAAAMHAVKP